MVEGFLLLSERFRWFAFNEQQGWPVLIAIGVVCVAVLVMLFWFAFDGTLDTLDNGSRPVESGVKRYN